MAASCNSRKGCGWLPFVQGERGGMEAFAVVFASIVPLACVASDLLLAAFVPGPSLLQCIFRLFSEASVPFLYCSPSISGSAVALGVPDGILSFRPSSSTRRLRRGRGGPRAFIPA